MQIKDLIAALAVPALCLAAAIPTPQEFVEPEFPEDGGDDIVGGVAAVANDFPFIVAISLNGGAWCGGSLLNANTVVTAAHCIDGNAASAFSVRAGSLNRASGGVTSRVTRIIANPSYNSNTFDSDVAIFKLTTPIATSSSIGYATLAASNNDPVAGSTATVAGWGDTLTGSSSPTLLRKVDVPIVSRATCRNNYSTSAITTNMFCAGLAAGGRDSCQGDSGGPIVTSTKTLIGIVSWGEGCAVANKPGVYTRVGTVLPFIQANL